MITASQGDQHEDVHNNGDDETIHSSQVPLSSSDTPPNKVVDINDVDDDPNTESTSTLNKTNSSNMINQPICRNFLKGNCKHGMSGKTSGGCKYRHLKTFNQILKHGTHWKYGCN